MTLADVRAGIDAIDGQIVKLLAVRAPDRRDAMMRALRERAIAAGVSPEVVTAVYTAIIARSSTWNYGNTHGSTRMRHRSNEKSRPPHARTVAV